MKAVQPHFELSRPTSRTSSIVLRLNVYRIRYSWGTGLAIDPKLWDDQSERPTKDRTLLSGYAKQDRTVYALCDKITSALDNISATAKEYFLTSGNNQPTSEDLRYHLDQKFRPEKVQPRATNLTDFVNQFVEEITNGKRLTPDRTRYAETTIKAYRSFSIRLLQFMEANHRVLNFKNIDQPFVESFSSYLAESHNNNPDSIGKQIKIIKRIMGAAQDQGLHENEAYKRFKVNTTESETVYLTNEELTRLERIDLSSEPKRERIRDLFLIGCYTAQRISDYQLFGKDHIKPDGEGGFNIEFRQKKTNAKVILPIMPELWDLLNKYDFQVPDISEQHLNREIKKIAFEAGITDPIHQTEYRKGVKVQIRKPKHDLISSHTARRTGATLMEQRGYTPNQIRMITGHKTLKSLQQYLRTTEEENAKELKMHGFFSGRAAL